MNHLKFLLSLLSLTALIVSQTSGATVYNHVAVANRTAGTLSLIGLKEKSLDLQPDLTTMVADFEYNQFNLGFEIEPMYVSKLRMSDPIGGILEMVTVADRKNSQVLFIRPMGGPLHSQIEIGKGAFHLTSRPNEVFVATDIEKGFNYIQTSFNRNSSNRGFEIINRRFDLPAELQTGAPHDIIGTDHFIYLTVHNVIDHGKNKDVLLQVDKTTLKVTASRIFSAEIHLFDLGNRFLILEQNSGLIRVVDSQSFKDLEVTQGPVGVHGVNALKTQRGTYIFVTDIDQTDGRDSLLTYRIDQNHQLTLTDVASTAIGTAHNIGILQNGVFVTHSGPSNSAVSILEFDEASEKLVPLRLIHTGLNPFGITGLTF